MSVIPKAGEHSPHASIMKKPYSEAFPFHSPCRSMANYVLMLPEYSSEQMSLSHITQKVLDQRIPS